MPISLWCLCGFVAWTLILVLTIGTIRVLQVLGGKAAPNAFPAGVPHGGDAYWRLNRAHLNCVENLPLFASVVLLAARLGVDPLLDTLAPVYLAARLGQSTTHLLSGGPRAVQVRFTFFLLQALCLLAMLAAIIRVVLG